MKKIVLLLIIVVLCMPVFGEKLIIRFDNPNKDLVEKFYLQNYDVASYSPKKYLDVVVTEEERDNLEILGYNFSIYQTEQEVKNNLRSRDLEDYTDYNELETILLNYELIYPEICKVFDIGDSWGKIYSDDNNYYNQYNHEILALKVSDNPDILEDEPSVYYLGDHHARETISVEVPLHILDYILSNYGTDDQITEDINNKQIWFVPMVNPNGSKIVLDETDVWWRKNIRDNNENGEFDSNYASGQGDDGVDPNRNYGFEWGNTGATDQISGVTYHGPNEFSEPETQATRDFIRENNFVGGISYHSYGEMVLYPFGYADLTFAPDNNALSELGNSMAELTPQINENGNYESFNGWELYPCMGGSDDWAYGEQSVFAYTVELAEQFIPASDLIEQICEDNLAAALLLLHRSDQSVLTGLVTDANTGEPLEAKITIDQVDNYGSFKEPYTCEPNFGRYYRFLLEGEYHVTISHPNYQSVGQNIVVSDEGQTVLDVALQPSIGFFENYMSIGNSENEPIANATITIENTDYENCEFDEFGGLSYSLPVGVYDCVITTEENGILPTKIFSDMYYDVSEYKTFISEFSDSFEDGIQDTWNNNNWTFTDQESALGSFSLCDSYGDYGNNETNIIEIDQLFDFEGDRPDLALSFYTKYSIEEGYDFCRVQIKEEGGSWIALDNIDGVADWHQVYYDLDYYIDKPFRIRFVFESDGGVTDDGIYIDGLHIVTSESCFTENNEDSVESIASELHNYPNPFNPKTTIQFNLKNSSSVNLAVYNVKGQKVKTLINKKIEAGVHKIEWNGTDSENRKVGSGVYFYKLKTPDLNIIKKTILLK